MSKNNNLSLNIAILLAILAPLVVLIQAFNSTSPQQSYGGSPSDESIAERIRPVVTLDDILGPKEETHAAGDTSVAAAAKTSASLYQGACLACHAAGVANAPKLGDKVAWEPRASLGVDTLLQTVINGKGVMPPKGGSSYSDDEIRSVIEYMLAEAGL